MSSRHSPGVTTLVLVFFVSHTDGLLWIFDGQEIMQNTASHNYFLDAFWMLMHGCK